eukprot:CAMPEP_0115011472 /NCGR_PEP_ID=MMETSP0216-20121206/24024_1 /TAXON_ID=223996 /ORGANISM="Protocruzia adherens, Strain Boccale" /LENGTH=99 /DNA_ID=CAMNT_0002380069 /DNA_START=111 /DNA_END=410 /DNA_ORIENTATION=+
MRRFIFVCLVISAGLISSQAAFSDEIEDCEPGSVFARFYGITYLTQAVPLTKTTYDPSLEIIRVEFSLPVPNECYEKDIALFASYISLSDNQSPKKVIL